MRQVVVFLLCFPFSCLAQPTQSLIELYQNHQRTFLCQEFYDTKLNLDLKHCKQCPVVQSKIKWMPIIPLKRLSQGRLCAQEKICVDKRGQRFKGLKCCALIDREFQQMRGSMFNYVPEVPELVRARKQYEFAPSSSAGTCVFHINAKAKRCEIAAQHFGFIARTYLYMNRVYHLPLSNDEIVQFRKWDKAMPADAWELERARKIEEIAALPP